MDGSFNEACGPMLNMVLELDGLVAGRDVRQLRRLVEISVTLNSTLEPESLLAYILTQTTDLLGCEGASILLFDEAEGDLRFVAATGADPRLLASIPVPIEGSVAGTIFTEGISLIIDDAVADARHYAAVSEGVGLPIRNLVGVPIRIRDRIIGVLEAINKPREGFVADDAELLALVAALAGVAIENARLVAALQRAYEELNQVDQVKSNFLALASHELRTPLMTIMGYAAMLQKGAGGHLASAAGGVMRSAERMKSVIEAMTRMRLIRLGAATIGHEPVSVQAVVRAASAHMEVLVAEKEQRLLLKMPSEVLRVRANAAQLEQAVLNLLRNAHRFTPEKGTIGITVAEDDGFVLLQVTDTGIGLPPDQVERVFDEFYQVEDHLTRSYGGLGLGLTIVRGIARMYGGHVWAESEGYGKGSTFTIRLPLLSS